MSTNQLKPRLNPEAKFALLSFYSRPDPIMANYVSKMRFLRFTLINKSLCTQTFMRRCSIRDIGRSNGFELTFNVSGASIRLSDRALFALMELVKPQCFRLCVAQLNSNVLESGLSSWILSLKEFFSKSIFKLASNEELRTRRLIELSSGATELVVGSSSAVFAPLIRQTAVHLNYLECSTDLLESAQISEPMHLNSFVAIQCFKDNVVPLRIILCHKIRRLDFQALTFSEEYPLESDLPFQPALKQLCIRSSLDNASKALDFYKNLQRVAPNLNHLELHLSADIDLSGKGQQISEEIVHIFDRLSQFEKQCRVEMQTLALHFTAYFSMLENSTYDKHWRKNLRQHPAIISVNGIEFIDIMEEFKNVEAIKMQLESLHMKFELRKYREFE